MATRFTSSIIPTTAIHAAAKEAGWDGVDDTPLDHLEDITIAYGLADLKLHHSLHWAVDSAKNRLDQDFFGAARVTEERFDEETGEWVGIQFWEIASQDDEPDYDDPDGRLEDDE